MRSSYPRERIDPTGHRGTTKCPIVRVNRENLARFVLICHQNNQQIDLSQLAHWPAKTLIPSDTTSHLVWRQGWQLRARLCGPVDPLTVEPRPLYPCVWVSMCQASRSTLAPGGASHRPGRPAPDPAAAGTLLRAAAQRRRRLGLRPRAQRVAVAPRRSAAGVVSRVLPGTGGVRAGHVRRVGQRRGPVGAAPLCRCLVRDRETPPGRRHCRPLPAATAPTGTGALLPRHVHPRRPRLRMPTATGGAPL